MTRPGGEDLPFVFSGTLVVQGQGIAQVRATGIHTEMGNIGKALQTVQLEGTRLQREIGRLVRALAVVGLASASSWIVVYGLTRGRLARGVPGRDHAGDGDAARRVPRRPDRSSSPWVPGASSQQHVLTRRVPAIETLGSATVLCVDKTGTLTVNRMSIRKLAVDGRGLRCRRAHGPGRCPRSSTRSSSSASWRASVTRSTRWRRRSTTSAAAACAATEHLHADWTLEREYPLSPELLAMSHVWKSPTGQDYVLAAKGAPEAIADLCHLNAERTQAIGEQVAAMAAGRASSAGRRQGRASGNGALPGEQHDFTFEFLGLVGLADPVRPTVPAAVEECYTAGIRVVMITGDHPTTAKSIARQVGLKPLDEIITGPELEKLDEAELRARVRTINVFARMVPEQKLRLVNALKANGEVVAMTGDGVNDAPALKAAHIGIAMGGRGTDVAREAASLVLLDDDFASIVQAVRMGRRIFDHLQKAMTYIVAVHVPIAGMSLLPVLLGWPLAPAAGAYPVPRTGHRPGLLHRLRSRTGGGRRDGAPAARPGGAAVRPADRDAEPARRAGVLPSCWRLSGSVSHRPGRGRGETLVFATLVVANLELILANLSWPQPHGRAAVAQPAVGWVFGGALGVLAFGVSVPYLRDLFRFAAPRAGRSGDLGGRRRDLLALARGSEAAVSVEAPARPESAHRIAAARQPRPGAVLWMEWTQEGVGDHEDPGTARRV